MGHTRRYPLMLGLLVLSCACRPDDSSSVKPQDENRGSPYSRLAMAGPKVDEPAETRKGELARLARVPGSGSYVHVQIDKTVKITKLAAKPQFTVLLNRFSITRAESFPASVIVAGRVVSSNTGGGEEGIPVFFGSRYHHPLLGALTDAYGEFRFRVWLRGEQRDGQTAPVPVFASDVDLITGGTRRPPLSSPSVEDGTLYIGGRFDHHMELTSTVSRVYAIKELLQKSKSNADLPSNTDATGQDSQN